MSVRFAALIRALLLPKNAYGNTSNIVQLSPLSTASQERLIAQLHGLAID